MLLILRLIHLLLGAFWVGSAVFLAAFLEPSLRTSGPAAGKVMLEIMKRSYSAVIASVALLTILSGFALFMIDAAGLDSTWTKSRAAHGYSVGAAAAVIALLVGLSVLRPTMQKLIILMADDSLNAPPPAEIDALRHKAMIAGRVVAALVIIAMSAMAVARYL
jgi:uncharacterized membrane protein